MNLLYPFGGVHGIGDVAEQSAAGFATAKVIVAVAFFSCGFFGTTASDIVGSVVGCTADRALGCVKQGPVYSGAGALFRIGTGAGSVNGVAAASAASACMYMIDWIAPDYGCGCLSSFFGMNRSGNKEKAGKKKQGTTLKSSAEILK